MCSLNEQHVYVCKVAKLRTTFFVSIALLNTGAERRVVHHAYIQLIRVGGLHAVVHPVMPCIQRGYTLHASMSSRHKSYWPNGTNGTPWFHGFVYHHITCDESAWRCQPRTVPPRSATNRSACPVASHTDRRCVESHQKPPRGSKPRL